MISSIKGWLHKARGARVSQQKPYPTISIVNFRPHDESINFGDELAPVVVDLMLAQRGYTRFDELLHPKRLLTVGSVMHLAESNDVIWGTGVNGKTPTEYHQFKQLDVRAVRGPRTRQFLLSRNIACPEVYGDPGLLVPFLAADRFKSIPKTKRVAFVPNLNDMKLPLINELEIPVISPLQSWHRAVAEILTAEYIVASSLHGIVIAEAFGIPARYVRLSEREATFKYLDYYEGTGRFDVEFSTSIAEAITCGGVKAPNFDKNALIASFPYDLWI